MTLKEFLDDITHCFKDKNIPLEEINVKCYIKNKRDTTELKYTGGYGSSGKKTELFLTFEEE